MIQSKALRGIAVAMAAVLLVAVGAFGAKLLESMTDRVEDAIEGAADGMIDGDERERLEEERERTQTKDLMEAVSFSSAEVPRSYVGNGSNVNWTAFMRAMPLGEYYQSGSVDGFKSVEEGYGAYTAAYLGVSHYIDGDVVDRALVYNAAAIFAAQPGMEAITVYVQEDDERQDERSAYWIDRVGMEQAIELYAQRSVDGVAGDDGKVLHPGALLDDTKWEKIRSAVTNPQVVDMVMSMAERD